MSRPKQCRVVMATPAVSSFAPVGLAQSAPTPVKMNYDEYEAIRLMDYEELQQSQAAELMNVSRPTFTRIYDAARKKVAKAIVEGCGVVITGDNAGFEEYQNRKIKIRIMNQKIAIPTMADGTLSQHFGRAPKFTFVTLKEGEVVETQVLDAPPHEHGSAPRFIAANGGTDVLCGGLGAGAVKILNELGIQVHGGAPVLPVSELVEQYLNGTIVYGDSSCHGGCHHHHD